MYARFQKGVIITGTKGNNSDGLEHTLITYYQRQKRNFLGTAICDLSWPSSHSVASAAANIIQSKKINQDVGKKIKHFPV